MMRSLWTGVTGLQNHQTKMDVIGNNIANVNTVGFKKSEVVFEDLLSQSTEIGHGPSEGRGGTNSQQVGLGVRIGAITQVHTQGQMQYTGKNTDLAISGNGFFVVNSGSQGDNHYTRNGSFNLDSAGTLVAANGYKVQGWSSSPDPVTGEIRVDSSTQPIGDIEIKVGQFQEQVKAAPPADINIFGMGEEPNIAQIYALANALQTSILFLRDSKHESALA